VLYYSKNTQYIVVKAVPSFTPTKKTRDFHGFFACFYAFLICIDMYLSVFICILFDKIV